jgi:hypothetical protein
MRPDEELKQLMAAARPGASDLASPDFARLRSALAIDSELSAQFQRSQAFDVVIASAFKSVEVPSGLADRILTQLRAGTAVGSYVANATVTAESEESLIAQPNVAPQKGSRGLSRRGLLAALGLGATAAAVAVIVRSLQPPEVTRPVTKAELAARIDQWLSKDWQATSWNSDVASAKIGSTPVRIDNALSVKPLRWQSYADAQGKLAVFDLAASGKAPAMLFVVPTDITHELPAYPDLPMPRLATSGGLATSAWQRDGYVHVLAVEETGQKLDEFINPDRLALA